MYFEIYPAPAGGALGALLQNALAPRQWRWRLRAGNHEILASGESYVNRADCEHVVALLKQTTFATPVHEAVA
jgi:uncharacterized protein YegP (UPF0339 family)